MKTIQNTPWVAQKEKIYDSKGRFVLATAQDFATQIVNAVNTHVSSDDVAELLVALEFVTNELRSHNNDEQGQKMITESLKVQADFKKKYNVTA